MIPLSQVLLTSSYLSSCVLPAAAHDRHLVYSAMHIFRKQRYHCLKIFKIPYFCNIAYKIYQSTSYLTSPDTRFAHLGHVYRPYMNFKKTNMAYNLNHSIGIRGILMGRWMIILSVFAFVAR